MRHAQAPNHEGFRTPEIRYIKCDLAQILAALAEGDAGAASARTYQHIMGADPVKEVSG